MTHDQYRRQLPPAGLIHRVSHVYVRWSPRKVCLLFYVLATYMVISGQVPTCDGAHNKQTKTQFGTLNVARTQRPKKQAYGGTLGVKCITLLSLWSKAHVSVTVFVYCCLCASNIKGHIRTGTDLWQCTVMLTLIVLPHWEIMPPAPWSAIPLSHIILTLSHQVLALS